MIEATLIYKEWLNIAKNATQSAFLAIDGMGKITHCCLPKRSDKTYIIGKQFLKILKYIYSKQNVEIIYNAYCQCMKTKNRVELLKIKHTGVKQLNEYFDYYFVPLDELDTVVLYINNVTENVLLTEEFIAMSQQYEAVNRELCVAMSTLDFRLMDIDQAHRKMAALYRITSIVQRTVELQEVIQEILVGINRELGYDGVSILLKDEKTGNLRVKASLGLAKNSLKLLEEMFLNNIDVSQEVIYFNDKNSTENAFNGVAIPLNVGEKVLGILSICTSEKRILQEYDLDLLRSLAGQISLTIAHANHVAKVQMQAITDGMTSLYNYRHFRTILEQEFRRAKRYQRPLSLLMIDIDHFKNYNDKNGHLVGDDALCKVADIIKNCCRDTDYVSRYGGEEFVVLLPETTIDEAYVIAERMRSAVAEYPFLHRERQPNGIFTISVGISGYPSTAQTDLELINKADCALYKAKNSFRNYVAVAT